jgi:hypothetical protein
LLIFPYRLFFARFGFGRHGSSDVFFCVVVVTKNEVIIFQITEFNDIFIYTSHAIDGRCIRLHCRRFIFKNDHVVLEFDVTLIVGCEHDIFYFVVIG